MSPELFPVRRPQPSDVRIASYAVELRGETDDALVQSAADEDMSALYDTVSDDDWAAYRAALVAEVDRRQLRSAVQDEVERRRSAAPVAVQPSDEDDIPF